MELKDKTALVIGGGSGIGLGIALALAGERCRVAISGRNAARLESGAAQFEGQPPILTHPCDASDRTAVDALFAWIREQLGPPEYAEPAPFEGQSVK